MSNKPKISAVIEDENSNIFSLKIVFADIYGRRKSIIVLRALLNDQRRLIAELNNHGANIKHGRNNQAVLNRIRASEKLAPHQHRAKDFGWQVDGSFVSFTRTLKPDKSNARITIPPLSPFTGHLVKKRNLRKWRK